MSSETSLYRVTLDLSVMNVGVVVDVSFRELTTASDDELSTRAKEEMFKVIQGIRPNEIVVDEIVEVSRFI